MQAFSSRVSRPTVVVQGCDDEGSAVARELHRAGYAVVLVDDADPPWCRRGMSYVDAWYLGGATLAGVDACFASSVRSIPAVLARGDMIAATTWSSGGVAAALDVIAVVTTRCPPRSPNAPDGVVTVLATGGGDAARPRALAPRAGRFSTRCEIAEHVGAGDLLGEVAGDPIVAPASGVLRGLSARGARVVTGQCVVEIDTGGEAQRCFGIAECARLVAQRTVADVRRATAIPKAHGERAAATAHA
jgi:xanthine dehydrogenase accessory factor